MPLYEYQCRQCGRRFERLRRLQDEAEGEKPQGVTCDCGSREVERIEYSRVAVQAVAGSSAGSACCNPGGT